VSPVCITSKPAPPSASDWSAASVSRAPDAIDEVLMETMKSGRGGHDTFHGAAAERNSSYVGITPLP
jgi:hypothetical protein